MKWPWWVGQECWEHSFSSVGRNQTRSKWGDFAHATDSACWRVTGLSIFTGPYSVMIKTILVFTVEIHSCMCVCDSPQMLGSSQLDGLVADAPCISAGWGFPWGRAGEDVPIGGDTLMYTCMYMCTCLYVSSIKTTAHLVVLVGTLVQNVHKTCVVWSMWSQGMDKDSVLWEFSCCSGSPETRQILALTKDDKQLLQPGNWSTYEKQLFTVHYAYTLYEELI